MLLSGVCLVRRLMVGALLITVILVLGLPYFLSSQIPSLVFSGTPAVRVYLHRDDRIQHMQLEDYLIGVVAAEMPAEFPSEALKAQAVAARTYVAKRISSGGADDQLHPGADVCDDHRHGQAWLSRQDLKKRWGSVLYYEYYYKVKEAVDETAGLVLTYQGELIDPAYHASCGGKTENSEDVWKEKLPYLRSVACPYDADPQPLQSASFGLDQLDEAMGTSLQAAAVSAGTDCLFGVEVKERTATGRPKSVVIGDSRFSAVAVRDLLGLRSTNFTCQVIEDAVTFVTSGYGHGVGMCQYGAKGMADHGYNYQVILGHYYSGVKLMKIEN
ncbi:MAG: Amidase enhancer precursor [Pelotomaculum sp. PtaB.Bin104]|nr:MAG: Amidase enhancer precursor [Pelotomaculum sp. PtaB.Bin104]